jgi:catalase (peroxidase I)
MDALQDQTDMGSFAALEPVADGFRNHLKGKYGVSAEALLIDRRSCRLRRPIVRKKVLMRTGRSICVR